MASILVRGQQRRFLPPLLAGEGWGGVLVPMQTSRTPPPNLPLQTGGGEHLQVELDALRQRQRGRIVDGVGLAAHVDLPCIRAGLAAAAGFLLAAERTADLRTAGADVDVRDAAIRTGRRQELLARAQVVGEDRRGQAL